MHNIMVQDVVFIFQVQKLGASKNEHVAQEGPRQRLPYTFHSRKHMLCEKADMS